jgi:hypothetical protein
MAIVNNQLTTTQLDAVTVGAGKRYAITNIMVCNSYSPSGPSAASRDATFDMHLIPNGNAKDDQVTIVVKELTLPAGETFTFDSEKIVLEEGDIVAFVASPDIGAGLTDLAATISYLEV